MLRVFVSMGLSRVGWSPVFLVLGIAIALGVLDAVTNADVRASRIAVILFCALGFGLGWGGYQLLRAGLPTGLFQAVTRWVDGE